MNVPQTGIYVETTVLEIVKILMGVTTVTANLDFNECENDTYTCDGDCKNSQGGWDCNCKHGYIKNTSHDGLHKFCIDIDECHNNTYTCIDNTDCINTEGGWQCLCEGKRVSKQVNNTAFECLPDFQYIATVVVKIYPEIETEISELGLFISNGIRQIFMQSDDLNSQIVLPVEITNNSKRELTDRMSTENFETAVTFILHLTKQSNKATLKEIWASIWESEMTFFFITTNVTSTVIMISGELDEDAAETKGLCSIPSVNYCNATRSVCADSNGQIQCNCRAGYHKETSKNKTCVPKEDKKEEVALVSTVSFSINTTGKDNTWVKTEVKIKITQVYTKMFPNVIFWIEVISIFNPSSHGRKR
ncbi:uncharacterized protein LOC128241366 [Mya arenaria]|uniref:uncharacterized protein LOC128241366 n=1 Tax=Mya arenaria TaxID=6604 RepID=UPI0022E7A8DB|nr:uncharacterized protein LOC128241366 [Mya arenaria]